MNMELLTRLFGCICSVLTAFCIAGCTFGYFLNINVCQQCLQGTYKDTVGDGGCTTCPGGTGTTSGTGATSVSECGGEICLCISVAAFDSLNPSASSNPSLDSPNLTPQLVIFLAWICLADW